MAINWRKIPVLGQLLRIASSFLKAPARFDYLYDENRDFRTQIPELQAQISELQRQISELQAQTVQQSELIKRVVQADPEFVRNISQEMMSTDSLMLDLNRALSAHPTIWGDPKRLHIAETAAVFTCFFNTNSGHITVGEYTFAGSRVSILAGSHDKQLTGLLRRDAEITEGCDIRIGNGVWLGSGCTLLGPCEVGDNAVIAAGAVVAPGNVVPENTVYAGIPAKKISEIHFALPQNEANPHVLAALRRNGGALFMEGWSEKKSYPGIPVIGHWLTEEEGLLLVEHPDWKLYYALPEQEECELLIRNHSGSVNCFLQGGTGVCSIHLPCYDGKPELFRISIAGSKCRLFIALGQASMKEE